jgi:predicted enzyme related to lactoylglutathione lyase
MVQLNLIVIKTNKLQEQAEFYTLLGIQFDYHKHGNGPYHYASITGNPVIEIYPLPKGVSTPDNTTRLGFIVDDLDGIIKNLKSQNMSVIAEPAMTDWGYSAIIQDHDGRKIELLLSR